MLIDAVLEKEMEKEKRGRLKDWQRCVRVFFARRRAERPSSPTAFRVIKIKAAVIGYSFWPRPVGYPFNGDCVRGKKNNPKPTSESKRD